MTLRSMTGFARADGHHGPVNWTVEVKSVNGRSLDVRFRAPPGFDGLEAAVRQGAARRFQRGNIQVGLQARRPEAIAEIRLNEKALAEVVTAAKRAATLIEAEPPRIEGLIAIRGVLEIVEATETEMIAAERNRLMVASLEEALDGLLRARAAEGARLQSILLDQVGRIDALAQEADKSPSRAPEAARQRLKEQVGRLLADFAALDQARLYQEAALIAARADVEEEIGRLQSHVAATRALLHKGGAVGRELDFLAQEMNREANTLCSKSNAADITRIGLGLKVVIDQFKEQVQNIE